MTICRKIILLAGKQRIHLDKPREELTLAAWIAHVHASNGILEYIGLRKTHFEAICKDMVAILRLCEIRPESVDILCAFLSNLNSEIAFSDRLKYFSRLFNLPSGR